MARNQRGFIALSPMVWVYGALALGVALFFLRLMWIQEGREQILRENVAVAVKIVKLRGDATERVVTRYVKVQGETQEKIVFRDREVIRYVESGLDQCPLSNAFVSLHDHAAHNTVPTTAGGLDGAPSGITAAQTLPIIQTNYSTCHQTADRLRALQEWVREQGKVSP